MRHSFRAIPVACVIVAAAVAGAVGQELSAGSKALAEANAGMHAAMAIEMTGDVDVDFMRSMIPHHEGAVEMAKIVIENGRDPDVRRLAEEIIAAQEEEIAVMKAWLKNVGADDGKAEEDHGAH